jgi:DNA-binding transcriptional ArsR family regulator
MNRRSNLGASAARAPGVACGPGEHPHRGGRARAVSEEAYARAAALFRAAGDVARLKLLDRLSEGEWCVTELAEAAGVGLSTVSQQLRTLRAERIVERRRQGKHTYYSLADRHVIDLIANVLEHASEEHVSVSAPDDDE